MANGCSVVAAEPMLSAAGFVYIEDAVAARTHVQSLNGEGAVSILALNFEAEST